MGYSGQTSVYRIPFMLDGDLMLGDMEKLIATIIDNQLQMAALGGPYIAKEGNYNHTLNPDGTVTVSLVGTPAVRGVLASSFLSVNGQFSWLVSGQGYYRLYLVPGSNILVDPSNVTPLVSTTAVQRDDYLYMADLDLTNPTLPVLNTTPPGKPILANLSRILNSPINPFGSELEQDHLTVGGWLVVVLDTNESLLVRVKSDSYQPAITLDTQGRGPGIRATRELSFADVRNPDGVLLSDAGAILLPDGANSIFDAIRRASKNPAVTDLLSPNSGLEENGSNILTDASKGNTFGFTLTNDKTLANPANGTDGQRVLWRVKQDSVGGRGLIFGTKFRFGSTIPSVTLSAAPNLTDYIEASYNAASDTWDVIRFAAGY